MCCHLTIATSARSTGRLQAPWSGHDRHRADRRPIAACQRQRRPTKKIPPRGRREPRTYCLCLNPEYDGDGSSALDVRGFPNYTDPHPPCSTQKNSPELNAQGYQKWVNQRYWLATLS